MFMQAEIHNLDMRDVDVLVMLLDAHIGLGLHDINGRNLNAIRTSLSSSTPVVSGIWDTKMGGDFSFSLFHRGSKIRSIKAIRTATGLGLKESKDIIDQAKPCADGRSQLLIVGTKPEFFAKLHDACDTSKAIFNSSFVEAHDWIYLSSSIKELLP